MEPEDKYADVKQVIATAAGIGDPGPIMRAYLDSLGIAHSATSGGRVSPPLIPPSYIPKSTIKHLGRPKAKS